jgi:hypothetical protein
MTYTEQRWALVKPFNGMPQFVGSFDEAMLTFRTREAANKHRLEWCRDAKPVKVQVAITRIK